MIHVDLAQYIGANTALTYSDNAGGNLFIDDLPSDPDRAVGVFIQGGTEADSKLPYDAPGVQIMVRADSSSPQWALDTCAEIYALLQGKRNLVLAPGATTLVFAIFRQSAPQRIGADEEGRMRYTLNLRTEILNPTSERPS